MNVRVPNREEVISNLWYAIWRYGIWFNVTYVVYECLCVIGYDLSKDRCVFMF